MPLEYWMALLMLLSSRFEREYSRQIRWKGFRLLAMDGTSIGLHQWPRLKAHFGTAATHGNQRTVQARMVMLQMPLVRMPYRYELAPLNVGETTLAMRLAEHLKRNDLLLIDRGFWSYALFCEVQRQGAYFGIRLKKGQGFNRVRRLGKDDSLVRWKPSRPVKCKWQKRAASCVRCSSRPPAANLKRFDGPTTNNVDRKWRACRHFQSAFGVHRLLARPLGIKRRVQSVGVRRRSRTRRSSAPSRLCSKSGDSGCA